MSIDIDNFPWEKWYPEWENILELEQYISFVKEESQPRYSGYTKKPFSAKVTIEFAILVLSNNDIVEKIKKRIKYSDRSMEILKENPMLEHHEVIEKNELEDSSIQVVSSLFNYICYKHKSLPNRTVKSLITSFIIDIIQRNSKPTMDGMISYFKENLKNVEISKYFILEDE